MSHPPTSLRGARHLDPQMAERYRRLAHVRRTDPARTPRRVRLWLPVTALAVLLSPLALLAIPVIGIVGARRRVNPFRVVAGLGAVLMALSGTAIDIEAPSGASVRIRLV